MKKIAIYTTLLGLLFSSLFVHAEIVETHSLASVVAYIDAVKNDHKKVMIIWDLDETVFTTKGMYGGDQWFGYELQKKVAAGYGFKRALDLTVPDYYQAQLKVAVEPTESDIIENIAYLQNQGHLVCALTARGSFIALKTQEHLESLGIDFSRSCPVMHMNHPDFFCWNGVMYAGAHEKGHTLISFLQYMQEESYELPTMCIVIDDKKRHLESIEKALLQTYPSIVFHGFRYAGSDHRVINFCPLQADKEKEKIVGVE